MTQELPEQPGRVPVGELRALVEDWREFTDVAETTEYSEGINNGVDSCADAIERVIERYDQ